jgi:hypothetical protein
MGRQRDVNEGDHAKAERLAGEVGMVARYHFVLLQPHPPPRTLRGRQPGDISQLLVGEAAVILQGAENAEIEAVNRYHAWKAIMMHRSCTP